MKSNKHSIKTTIKWVLLSLILTSIFMNCSRNKFEPYSDLNSSSQSQLSTNVCSNGAANYPTCSITAFGNCINGNTNPPTCTTGGNSMCSNGAANFPTCSLTSNGSCINGTVNPPACNSFNSNMCPNGATNYPACNNNAGNSCPNGAVNYPTCSVDANNTCLNGATNPPPCNNSSAMLCPNGAANYPTCTTTVDNLCINGATNPPTCNDSGSSTCINGGVNFPDCTITSKGACVNGNTNPPDCNVAPVTVIRVFDVIENISGALYSYSVKIDMEFNEADIHQKGAIFLFAQLGSRTIVCTNPCTSTSQWKEWNGAIYDWSTSGLRANVGVTSGGVEGRQTVLSMVSFDATTLGGYKVYAGYGKGNDVTAAINEMLGYRSSSLPSGRYMEVLTVPIQNRTISITGPGGGSPGPLTNYNLYANIAPSYLDYGKPGYFYITIHDPGNTVRYFYRQKASGGYEWVLWDGTVAGLGASYFKYDPLIKNEYFQFVTNLDVTAFKGWYVYAGYGNGLSTSDAANDCINNSKFNATPFIVK